MDLALSIVIPVYKNAATLAELHRRLTLVATKRKGDYEILFVDDACPYGSLDVLRDLAGRDASVAVLALEMNVGQNRAVMAGLAHSRGKAVVVLDADLQDPPEAIPLLLAALEGEAAAVFGGRRGRYESGSRLATSRVFKQVLHVLSRRRLPPDAGLFVAMKRVMVERLMKVQDLDPYVVGLIGRAGLPLLSIPVERAANPAQASSYTVWMRLRLAWRAIKSITGPFQSRPTQGKPLRETSARVREYVGARFVEEINGKVRVSK